jgi:hypothetical protein
MKKNKINQVTVDAFSKKLKEWSKTLPKEERSLVRLLIDRATAVNVGDLGDYDLTAKVGHDAERVFKSLQKVAQELPIPGQLGLIKFGDLWLKSTTTKPG